MNFTKNTTVFDKMVFPKKPNYEYVGEYFASKVAESSIKIANPNTGDDIERMNVIISNYIATQQLEKTTRKLTAKRNAYQQKRKCVLEMWKDLQVKEESFRQNFIRFNQFVKENQEKKERAANKIMEQNSLKQERERKMNALLEICEQIKKVKAKMDANIGRYRIYEEFLMEVVDYDSSMQSINDLLKRYDALIEARKELNDIQQRDLNKLEKAKSNLKELISNYTQKIEKITNQIQVLHERYEKAKSNCRKWEQLHKHTKLEVTEMLLNTVAVKEICKKMYLEICHRKRIKPTYIDDTEKQLITIKQAIGEYEIINRRVTEMEEKDLRASIEAKDSYSTIKSQGNK
ncbi:coiled-coil domain-containing protein 42 homolog isoform X2 [Sitophilus oryzae]|uniref:Coiled-coil domain-containing protein 42 homolog isoform X2 n=1 Tax=Sitophilus oryzae TaxID=7048 RepID=A0A6J2X9N6_SITOR|nr:coiled-coil domain-containing protein 42 homolog isoform X2 [Sitophilus oryzae]